MQIDQLWLTFIVGTVLPALVALVTSRLASSAIQGVVLALLSAVSGTLVAIQANNGNFEIETVVTNTFIAFITAVSVHYGLLKPTGVTGNTGAIASAVPGGIGGSKV